MNKLFLLLFVSSFMSFSAVAEEEHRSFEGFFTSDYLDEVEVAHPMARRSLIKNVNAVCESDWELLGEIEFEITEETSCQKYRCTRSNRAGFCVGGWDCTKYRDYFKMTALGEFSCTEKASSTRPRKRRCYPSREIKCGGRGNRGNIR